MPPRTWEGALSATIALGTDDPRKGGAPWAGRGRASSLWCSLQGQGARRTGVKGEFLIVLPPRTPGRTCLCEHVLRGRALNGDAPRMIPIQKSADGSADEVANDRAHHGWPSPSASAPRYRENVLRPNGPSRHPRPSGQPNTFAGPEGTITDFRAPLPKG